MTRGTRLRSKRGSFLVLLVAVLALVGASFGAEAAGAATKAASDTALASLKVTTDRVTVKAHGKTAFAPAKNGQALHQGDTVQTDADGRAEIDYTDGSLTRLGATTVFTISRLTDERGGRQTQGTLSVGETWNRAAKVSETGSFEVKAGGTTAAVEGTAFVVRCLPNADGPPQSTSCSITAVVDDIHVDSDAWDVTSATDTP